MKKIFILLIIVSVKAPIAFGQCSSLFSFAINSETVNFTNQSTVPNAHYFWNFGDGTGSNAQSPVHTFPENGKYLVTLFARDTVTNCSTFYEKRLNIIKLSNDICQPDSILDSISYNGGSQALYLNLIDKSLNCSGYSEYCEAGVNSTMPSPAYLGIFDIPSRYVSRINYIGYDSNINQYVNRRVNYKTIPYRYSSSKNYNSCSANFEFKTISQDANGERILFTAMNKTATAYKWQIEGVTSLITSANDTVSAYFPFNINSNRLFMAILYTTGSTGCKDTLLQIIRGQYKQIITGLNEHYRNDLALNIYPNPAQDKLIVSAAVELDKMTLINTIGQEVFVLHKPQLKQEINISGMPAGIYFLKAENKNAQAVFKFIKD